MHFLGQIQQNNFRIILANNLQPRLTIDPCLIARRETLAGQLNPAVHHKQVRLPPVCCKIMLHAALPLGNVER